MKKVLNVFISYSNRDANFFNEIVQSLSILKDRGAINLYHDQQLKAGEAWEEELNRYIHNADIILFLVSPDSLTSDHVSKEIQIALAQAKNNVARVTSILLRNCDWKSSPLSAYYFLPPGATPLESFPDEKRREVYVDIVKAMEKMIGTFQDDWYEIIKNEFNSKTGVLNLSNYSLTSIPTQVVEMHWLHSLILTNNQLEEIFILEKLGNLESLDVSYNKISRISGIAFLPKLASLDISSNSLEDINEVAKMENLEILYAHKNHINKIPDLSGLEKLTELDLSNNKIHRIEGIENLANLRVLNLSGNKLQKIEGLPMAPNLYDLKLMDNAITTIEGLDHLKNLRLLDLFKNQLTVIENLDYNIHLQTLGLSINKITLLQNISHLGELEVLYVAHNLIEDISELQNMHKLRRVVLTNNRIFDLFPLKQFIENDLPVKAVYSFDSNEVGFFVKDNPVQYPPPEVLVQGKDAILRNFQQQADALLEQLDPYQSTEIKLILLGNANVGKTFLATYIKSQKTLLPLNNASTHGMLNEFVMYEHPSFTTPVKMRILDFGGQEYYHDTHHLFFTNDTIYLLLWEKDSNRFGMKTETRFSPANGKLEEETNAVFPIAYWLDAVHFFITKKENERKQNNKIPASTGLDPVVILVETKRNKKGFTLVDTASLLPFKNLVHSQAAISIYLDANQHIVETGTDALFDNLNDLVGSMFEKRWSGYYGLIVDFFEHILSAENQQLLQEVHANDLIINLHDCIQLFNKIIKKQGLKYKFDNDNAVDLCRFLANRGYILFFDHNKICLSPNELTAQIYLVLNRSYNQVGIISSIEAAAHDAGVVSIMQDFKLLVPHPAGSGFIAPQLLPDTTNNQLNLFLDAFKPPMVRFSIFGYIHKNIIQELFYSFKEKLLPGDTQNYIWKNGFIIRLENELYKININSNENCRLIEIQYLNNFNPNMMVEISELITSVLEGRRYHKEVSVDGKFFVPVDLLEKNLQLSQFLYDGKLLRLADYKNFLDADKKLYSMKKLFISYSSKNSAFMRRFVTHLEPLRRNGTIDFWHDRMIEPGTKWDDTIKKELELSDVVVFLLSPDFIATSYIFEVEIPQVLQQFAAEKSKMFFVELQACSWEKTILKNYQQTTDTSLDNKAVITITDPLNDNSWKQVIGELEKVLK